MEQLRDLISEIFRRLDMIEKQVYTNAHVSMSHIAQSRLESIERAKLEYNIHHGYPAYTVHQDDPEGKDEID
jgi:hypothetical protein